MITIQSNIQVVIQQNMDSIGKITKGKDDFLRTVATVMVGKIRERVHMKGKASDGSQIGTYSAAYMRVRTGLYSDSKVVKSGKTAGRLLSAGTFSKRRIYQLDLSAGQFSNDRDGKYKYQKRTDGAERPKYNRGIDRTVILSLTRQQESDMTVIATSSGYGIGYNNPVNYQKSQWEEKMYKKEIWNLTTEEMDFVMQTATKFSTDAFPG